MIHEIGQWMQKHVHISGLPVWASVIVIAVAMATVSLVVTAVALINIPADYFTEAAADRPPHYRHPIIRWALRILRNIIGWFLIILGILLCFPGVPGQGLLTILLGVMLAEFPGKRRMEMKIIRMKSVSNAVNRFRSKFGKPELIIDNE